jgi:uncharacterized protein (TIRG00374 family)
MRHRRSKARSAARRTIFVVIFLLMFNYLILPRLAGATSSADLIREVNPVLLVFALSLEIAAFVAYAKLTQVTLPLQPHLSLLLLVRIQLSTKAVTNLVPGGSAAGGTVGYRLLTEAGVSPPAATFTIATVGLGSAVVLNLLLWLALLISIPLHGFNPLYLTAAIVGLILLLAMAALVLLLMKGTERAERVLGSVARHTPFVDERAATRMVRQAASRLIDLLDQPNLIARCVFWATANWVLDAASLWVFLRAFGASVNPINLIVAFGLANVLAAIPLTPGGLGVVEAVLTPTLIGFGLTKSAATVGVLAYRFAQFWLPIPLGGLAYASLRFGKLGRHRRLDAVRDLAAETASTADKRYWDPVTGEYSIAPVATGERGETDQAGRDNGSEASPRPAQRKSSG